MKKSALLLTLLSTLLVTSCGDIGSEGGDNPGGSENTKLKISESNKGKVRSEEWKENLSQSLKNKKRHWYTNGIENLCISEGANIPEGFYPGRYVSEEFKKSCGIKNVGKTPWNKGKKLK